MSLWVDMWKSMIADPLQPSPQWHQTRPLRVGPPQLLTVTTRTRRSLSTMAATNEAMEPTMWWDHQAQGETLGWTLES